MSKPNAVLDDFLEDIFRRKKEARVKRPEPISEPGGYMGRSTHPSASTDDNLIEGRTGARAAENTRDVKENREKPSVDATSEASKPAGDGTPEQDKRQLNIGLESSSTGADPGVEDDYKGTKDDPGTSHPMKADDGQKYAAYRGMPLAKLASHFAARRDSILAKLASGEGTEKRALNIQHANAGATHRVAAPPAPAVLSPTSAGAATPAAPAAPGLPTASATKIAGQQAAAQQGYQLAAALGTPEGVMRKRAMAMIEATVKEADLKADLCVQALQQYASWRSKQAGDPDAMQEGEGHESKGGPPGGPGGPGGAAPPPAPALPPDAGGAPGGAPGGDPTGGAGGDPQASPEQTVHELAAALLEMGIDPAELAAAAEQLKAQAGGAGGPAGPGGAPGGPGGDPMAQAKIASAQAWIKAAGAVRSYKRSGRFSFGSPKTAELELLRSKLKGHINELMRYSG